MRDMQVLRYTELAKRYSEIVLLSGIGWKPEYSEELQRIDAELAGLRKELIK